MGWSIAALKNTVEISDECAQDLFENANTQGLWDDVDDVTLGEGALYFNADHSEHMDFLWDETVQEILKKHGAAGEICFGSLDGDNAGSFWGYRFDGQGNMTELKGTVQWQTAEEAEAKMAPVAAVAPEPKP